MLKTLFLINVFFALSAGRPLFAWSWGATEDDHSLLTLRQELDREIASYRQQVGTGMTLRERIIHLGELINSYKPSGLNVAELETERSRLELQEKQQELRTSEMRGQATTLYDRGVSEYRQGQYQAALTTFRDAEQLLPQDTAIKELRKKLESIVTIIQMEAGEKKENKLVRLAVTRFLENDPKRALNTLIYASDNSVQRPELTRLHRLIETAHPEIEAPRIPQGIGLINHKLQLTLEAIYDGRYLTAIAECSDVLDLEPENVLALTRLGSAYYAMNEKERAKQIWTKALQIDPRNEILKKFLYGSKGGSRVETKR